MGVYGRYKMKRVHSDPTFNRYSTATEPPPKPRPLSRRFVVASMIDLAMPRLSASIDAAIENVVTEAFATAPKDPEGIRVIKANLEK